MTVTDGSESAPAAPSNRRQDPTATDLAELPDRELLALVRSGEDDAFGELFVRHASAVRGFAARCTSDAAEADDMAAEAFFRVFQAVRRGSGPDDNVRAYLLTVVRRLAAEWRVRRRDVPVADDELGRQVDADVPAPVSPADLQLIARAFTTLPWRWRAVLWRVEVEGERPAVVARHFGLSANATAALARRARQGLRAAYLQAHLAPSRGAHGCRTVVAKLGGFTAGQVTGTEAVRIRQHLAACPSCSALHAELLDVCAGLRRYAGATPLAGAGLGLHGGLQGGVHAGLQGGLHGGVFGKLVTWIAAGARMKVAVAAVSMLAVGGFAAGPLIMHLPPAQNADRGPVVGPLLTEQQPAPSARTDGMFDPTRSGLHANLRGDPQARQARPIGVPIVLGRTTHAVTAAVTSLTTSSADDVAPPAPGPPQQAKPNQVQMQASPVPTTDTAVPALATTVTAQPASPAMATSASGSSRVVSASPSP